MRDLNPMQFFRGQTPEAKPDASQVSKTGMAGQPKPMTKVPSLLFDIEVATLTYFALMTMCISLPSSEWLSM